MIGLISYEMCLEKCSPIMSINQLKINLITATTTAPPQFRIPGIHYLTLLSDKLGSLCQRMWKIIDLILVTFTD